MKSVLGVDLSLTGTGLALIRSHAAPLGIAFPSQLVLAEPPYFLHTAHLNKCPEGTYLRWRYIRDMVMAAAGAADLVIIEGYSFGSHMAHARSIAEIGGIVRFALVEAGKSYIEVPPSVLKKFVAGRGVGVQKNEMLLETYKRWNLSFNNADICDAFGLAMIGRGMEISEGLPQFQADIIEQLKHPKVKKSKAKAGKETP